MVGKDDRRLRSRTPYRVRAELKLFSDPAEAAPWLLFTRDIDAKGVGFITAHRLPLDRLECRFRVLVKRRKQENPCEREYIERRLRNLPQSRGWQPRSLTLSMVEPALPVSG